MSIYGFDPYASISEALLQRLNIAFILSDIIGELAFRYICRVDIVMYLSDCKQPLICDLRANQLTERRMIRSSGDFPASIDSVGGLKAHPYDFYIFRLIFYH